MSGPGLAYRTRIFGTRGAMIDHLMTPGETELRPCGCQNDPVVFGHTWSMCPIRRREK